MLYLYKNTVGFIFNLVWQLTFLKLIYLVCIHLVKSSIYLSLDLSSSYLTLPITIVFICSFPINLDFFWIDWIYLFILYSFYDVVSSFSVSECILFRSYLGIKIHILDPPKSNVNSDFHLFFGNSSALSTLTPLVLLQLVCHWYSAV